LSYATISHKTLNKVGAAAGLNSGETGTLVWTVMASRGLNSVMAKESKKLTITRLVGFEEIPAQLYLTGSATEGGMDASKAVACASPEKDKFEVFTKLEGGKTYKLVDRAAEGAKVFYINGNKIMEGEGETTVEKTGVYRIEMDFSIASVTVREVRWNSTSVRVVPQLLNCLMLETVCSAVRIKLSSSKKDGGATNAISS